VRANLDRDRALERIVGVEEVSSDHAVWRASVRIVDRCGGRTRSHLVLDGYPRLETARAVHADARGPREVLALLRGAAAGSGEARLVRLAGGGRCPRVRPLFEYVAARAERAPVPELRLTWFTLELVELRRSFAGRELRLTEQFQIPEMLSSTLRETLYRYDGSSARYTAYAQRTYRRP
jgi:hypothetical protein